MAETSVVVSEIIGCDISMGLEKVDDDLMHSETCESGEAMLESV